MSKIDKLGGYKNAKEAYEFLNSCRWHRTPEPDIDALGAELLEYRRANNIFEVGDFVLPISGEFSIEVCELTEDYLGLDFKYKNRSGGFGYIVKSFMPEKWRHATDEEIASGYRGAK